MVTVARGAIAVVAATLVCGCGGGKEQKQLFTAADVTRIASVGPVAPGWTWPRDPEKPAAADSSTESAPNDPLLVRLKRQMAGLVDIAEASNEWRDNNKLGHLDLGVFGSADDAGKAFAASNAFSRGWGARSGHITKAAEIDGLGDEAWVLWVGGPGTQVTYHWRRGNLTLEAHVHCFGMCPGDVDAAAHAWADAIDAEARARPWRVGGMVGSAP